MSKNPFDTLGAFTLDDFCASYGVSRSRVYREINAQRLIAKKLGSRTVIERSEARRWFDSLPCFEPRQAQVAA